MRPSKPGPTGTRTTSPVPRDEIAGFDALDLVEQHAADGIVVQSGGKANLAVLEAQQLVQPDAGKAGNEWRCRRRPPRRGRCSAAGASGVARTRSWRRVSQCVKIRAGDVMLALRCKLLANSIEICAPADCG